jgi:hypothetical protein
MLMIRRFLPTAATLLLLGACAMPPPAPSARLPYDALVGAGDPVRSAVASTSFAFSHQGQLAGQPADAARALAQMEYLAVELPNNPRFVGGPANLQTQMLQAREEWREALGIPPGLPPQPVIDSLYAAARALRAGQPEAAAAALPTAIFPQGGQVTLTRLAALPGLPRTNTAAVGATEVLRRAEGDRRGKL